MKKIDAGQALTILANVGVIFGLVLLYLELRQNNDLMRAEVHRHRVKFLVDMNLSPSWVQALESQGISATHWSSVGDGRALDAELMAWV